MDAPCSGTGTLGRNPEIKWRLKPDDLQRHHLRQSALLAQARAVLAPGGLLVVTVLGMSGNGSSNLVFADGDGATKAGLGVDARGQGSFTLADKGLQQQTTEPEPGDSEVADSQSQPAQQPVKPARKK